MNNIMVSVVCTAYNHEKYIRDALEGFVRQKTDFPFEVLINDDASTDGTADIIKEYEKKYPEIIKPVYQTENQYSKGIRITNQILIPMAKGKYIAYCEGDDYWCDENKLQMQVDYLESHPECSACVHNTYFFDVQNMTRYVMFLERETDLSLNDCIMGWPHSYHTSSLMTRAKLLKNLPEFVLSVKGVGDHPLSIFLALSGNIHYCNYAMSVYRYCTESSWTLKMRNNLQFKIKKFEDMAHMLEMADSFSGYRFHNQFKKKINLEKHYAAVLKKERLLLLKYPYYHTLYVWKSIKNRLKQRFPFLTGIRGKIRKIGKNESR